VWVRVDLVREVDRVQPEVRRNPLEAEVEVGSREVKNIAHVLDDSSVLARVKVFSRNRLEAKSLTASCSDVILANMYRVNMRDWFETMDEAVADAEQNNEHVIVLTEGDRLEDGSIQVTQIMQT